MLMIMKQDLVYPELKRIENEIQILKVLVIRSQKIPKNKVSLEGMLKGIRIEEGDIEEAKKAIFKFGA